MRRLTVQDQLILRYYAKNIPLEPRARLIPEERLEALIISGDRLAVESLLRDEPSGLAEVRRRYLMSKAQTRDRQLIDTLRDIYSGECQVCSWNPRKRYDVDLCEGHHIHWLSQGGEDLLENMVLLCPNHHRSVHRCFAPFDWEAMGFVFKDGLEGLQTRCHNLVA